MRDTNPTYRYGVAEWYGRPFHLMTREERLVLSSQNNPREFICPFRTTGSYSVQCTKKGGVCSLRLYQKDANNVSLVTTGSPIVSLCPHRFKEDQKIFEAVALSLLNTNAPVIVTEVNFLQRERQDTASEGADDSRQASRYQSRDTEDVGQIDYILVNNEKDYFAWCALELQAVYFSGPSMGSEFSAIASSTDPGIPFPSRIRRPDYRSSGPKRLMPQLQIKVPALRRWGKKMAVVVDRNFFNAMGTMDTVDDVSNSDIIWFVVDYRDSVDEIKLYIQNIYYTTLERAIEGLTAGRPVSLSTFEQRIRDKISKEANTCVE